MSPVYKLNKRDSGKRKFFNLLKFNLISMAMQRGIEAREKLTMSPVTPLPV